MLETWTRLNCDNPAALSASSKLVSFSLCLPAPRVRNILSGIFPSTEYLFSKWCDIGAVSPRRRIAVFRRSIWLHYDRGSGIVNAKIKRERQMPFPLGSTLNVRYREDVLFLGFLSANFAFRFCLHGLLRLGFALSFLFGLRFLLGLGFWHFSHSFVKVESPPSTLLPAPLRSMVSS